MVTGYRAGFFLAEVLCDIVRHLNCL